jgi:hypothetical protein
MQRLMDDDPGLGERRPIGQRAVIIASAVIVTSVVAAFALIIGNWAFRYKERSMHDGRLARLLPLKPTLEQVVAGLEQEGSMLHAKTETREELVRFLDGHEKSVRDRVLSKADRWAKVRVFKAGDWLYFIFFDHSGVMRGYACEKR